MKSPTTVPLPLAVDLDGTLVRADTLHELIVLLLKKNFLYIFSLVWWARRGAAYLKHEIALRVKHAVELLPYNEEIVSFLRQEKIKGRKIVLATASSKIVAQRIADYLDIFSDVIGSTENINYKGSRKAAALVARWGKRGFSYLGNAATDVPVWQRARDGMVASNSSSVIHQAQQATEITHIFTPPKVTTAQWLSLLRVYQWVKNLLLFLPLIAAHKIRELPLVVDVVLAFGAFSLAASAVYIANDLLDLEADRRHPQKRRRPFASGNIGVMWGMIALPLLVIASIVLATLLPPMFGELLFVYFIGTTLYSFYLKRIVVIDVLVLSLLYTVRIFAGAAAITVPVSSWLTAFAMFFFLSLAIVKRYTELQRVASSNGEHAHGRGYHADDRVPLSQLGMVSGYVSAVILALYISSEEINQLYRTPELLWLLVPLLLYWISRVWVFAHRGVLTEDPIIFAARDTTSYITAIVGLLIVLAAAVVTV